MLWLIPKEKERGKNLNFFFFLKTKKLGNFGSNFICDNSRFKGDKSLQRIEQDILKRPSSGVYINKELVSWVLVHNDNSMGIMYTKKEHRNKNYALEVTIDLAKKILESGKIPFLHIIDSNKMSPSLASKAGFTKHSYVNWFGISI